MIEKAGNICGISEGPCRHKEAWRWNDDVAETVKFKKALYRNWRKERSKDSWEN